MKRFLTWLLLAALSFSAVGATIVVNGPVYNAAAGGAAVAFDAKMAAGNSGDGLNQECPNATSCSSTGITVGASATILVGILVCQNNGANPPGAPSMTWNAVSMTAASTIAHDEAGKNLRVSILYLTSPAAGANTLAATTAFAADCYMSAASFRNSTGINAGDNTTVTATTVTVTSDANGATVAVFGVDGSTPTVNFVKIFAEAPLAPGGGASYQLGGTSNAHTFTGAGGTIPLGAGIHIVN